MQTNPRVLGHVKHPCKRSLVTDPEFNLDFFHYQLSVLHFLKDKHPPAHFTLQKEAFQLTYEIQEEYNVIEQLLWRHCGLCIHDGMGD